jgi:hypothetical protein
VPVVGYSAMPGCGVYARPRTAAIASTIRCATVWKRSRSRGAMYSLYPACPIGVHVPLGNPVKRCAGSAVWVGAWPHG